MLRVKTVILAIVLFLNISMSAQSAYMEGNIPTTLTTKNQNLVLNGSGIRNKCWIDLYTGALYLKQKSNDASRIINADEIMSIKIVVTSDVITAKRLEDNMRSEFKRVTNGNIAPYKDKIESLVKAFREDVKKGDTYDIIYYPGEGVKIFKNQKLKSEIAGLDFKKVLFTIWFGNDPQDEDLKDGMLGKS